MVKATTFAKREMMGLFAKKKKGGDDAAEVTAEAELQEEEARRRRKFLAGGAFLRKKKSHAPRVKAIQLPENTPGTEATVTPSLLESLNVKFFGEDLELMTLETQRLLELQREEIRRKLFSQGELDEEDDVDSSSLNEDIAMMRRVATSFSQEVTREGKILDADYATVEDIKLPRFASAPTQLKALMNASADDEDNDSESERSNEMIKREQDVFDDVPFDQGIEAELHAGVLEVVPSSVPVWIEQRSSQAQTVSQPNTPEPPLIRPRSANLEARPVARKTTPLVEMSEEKKDDLDVVASRVVDREETKNGDDSDIMSIDASPITCKSSPCRDSMGPSPTSLNFSPKRIVDALQGCTQDSTVDASGFKTHVVNLFYDKLCQPKDVRDTKRPYYNEEFTLEFLHTMMMGGVALLYLQPPNSKQNPANEWSGRSVNMVIEPGTTGDDQEIQPKLEWTTAAGGKEPDAASTISVNLLSVLSIRTKLEEEKVDDHSLSELCFFTITTSKGDVHIFEANSPSVRDHIVTGLKNVIARLSHHLIAGDATASSELYCDQVPENGRDPADLPMLASKPHQAMNRLSHTLLD